MRVSIGKVGRFAALGVTALCACASAVATQAFNISTEIAMPAIPRVPTTQPQTVSLTARFGSCSATALGNLDKLRSTKHVDSADVWLVVRNVHLRSNTNFKGIQNIKLDLVTPSQTIAICDQGLSDSAQESDVVDCDFEHRLKAEDLCSMLSGNSTGVAEMNIDLTVAPANVTLTSLSATIEVDTELDLDVSL